MVQQKEHAEKIALLESKTARPTVEVVAYPIETASTCLWREVRRVGQPLWSH